MKQENILIPIHTEIAPSHTNIKIQCFTCNNFEICGVKKDYLKTAQLIQNIVGQPCENYEWKYVPEFCGEIIPAEYLPQMVESVTGTSGELIECRYTNETNAKVIYTFGELAMFMFDIEKTGDLWEVSNGRPVYKCCKLIEILLTDTNKEDIGAGLDLFFENIPESVDPPMEVINTTFFTAALHCEHYSQIKGLSYEDGYRRLTAKYPDGVKIDDCGELYHFATFHFEKDQVPCYHEYNGKIVYAPYPVFPKPCPKKKKKPLFRRGDLSGD